MFGKQLRKLAKNIDRVRTGKSSSVLGKFHKYAFPFNGAYLDSKIRGHIKFNKRNGFGMAPQPVNVSTASGLNRVNTAGTGFHSYSI